MIFLYGFSQLLVIPHRKKVDQLRSPQTRPQPLSHRARQAGTNRILQDVTHHGDQMLIALNRETFKPPLPDVPAAAIVFVISAHVAGQQPLHELTQCGWVRRFENEMKVIRHQGKTEQLNPIPLLRFRKQKQKRFVVLWFVKYRGSTVATVDNVVRVPALLSSWYPRHRALLARAASIFQRKSSLSPFLARSCYLLNSDGRLQMFRLVLWSASNVMLELLNHEFPFRDDSFDHIAD